MDQPCFNSYSVFWISWKKKKQEKKTTFFKALHIDDINESLKVS